MKNASQTPFALPARGSKPRTRGLTSMIDFGPDTFGWTGGEHGIHHITVEQCEIDLLAAASPDALAGLANEPWFENLVIEVDPYRFPEQHAGILRDFGPEVNLANVTPGQILRLEGFRRGIGRAVNYWVVSGDASRPAGIHR